MVNFDTLVIGAGMAGMSAGLAAAELAPASHIAIVAPSPYEGGCGRETHAFNAAVAPGDTWQSHAEDTMAGGGHINDPSLVERLCQGAVEVAAELDRLGVGFDTVASGEHDLGTYGGSSRSRALHRADLSGLDISNAQLREAIARGCALLPHLWLVELAISDGVCHGAIFYDAHARRLRQITAATTVLATGGGACVYPIATISRDKQASGIAAGLRNGLHCVDMEMVQFHPTGLAAPGSAGHGTLFEEELRTLGARLLNADGHRFMFDYDPRGERATRDVVSRGCFLEITAGRGTERGGVILDLETLLCDSLLERFPNSVRRLRAHDVDLLVRKQVHTSPTAHFLMGGLKVDSNAATKIEGLYVCGEDAGGIHGGNRLGGNGVAEALVFGRIAGRSAAEAAPSLSAKDPMKRDRVTLSGVPAHELTNIDAQLREVMWNEGGLARTESGLIESIATVAELRQRLGRHEIQLDVSSPAPLAKRLIQGQALANRLLLAHTILVSALERPRSVAAHYRRDCAASEPEEPYSVKIALSGGDLTTSRLARRRPGMAEASPTPIAA